MCIVCAAGLQLTEGGFSGRRSLDHPEAATTVSDYRALAASSWNRNPWSDDFGIIPGRGAFISFSFEVGPTNQAIGYGQAFAASFTPWTAAQLASARQALAIWGEASGITFLEVPAGRGDIRFAGNYDFNLGGPYNSSQAAAYAGFPNQTGSEVFFGRSTYDSLQIFLHEIGHALGLKHPFEGDFVLSSADDNYAQSIMSYTRGGLPGDRLGTLDVAAIQYLYGTPDRDGTQVSAWTWNAQTHTLSQTGSAGVDFIRGIGGNNVIDAGAGDDDISSQGGSSTITAGDGNDQIVTGAGDNVIDAGAGNDQISLRGGRDRVTGGDGNDSVSVQWSANARFTVDGGAGTDSLTINADFFSTVALTFNLAFLADTGSSYTNIEILQVSGGAGNDVITLAGGNESAYGNAGNDRLVGLGGNDLLSGGAGSDHLEGGDGNDSLYDEMSGTFLLDGGAGSDFAVFQAPSGVAANWSLQASIAAGSRMVGIETVYLYGGSLADRVTGSSGAEYIAGFGGNDVLMGLGGSDTIVGGDGIDTAVYAGLRGGYSSVTQTRVAGGREGGADTLQTMERIKFLDGTISFETGTAVWIQDEATIAVARLYQVCLGRTPDLGGLEHYRNAVDQGYDLMHFTKSMIESPEFISRFGALTNQQFVEQVYRFVLGREGDAVGVSGYVAALSQGYSRADVVLVFSESPENKLRYQTTWETQVRTLENGLYPAGTTDDDVLAKGDGALVLWGDGADGFLAPPEPKDDIIIVWEDALTPDAMSDAAETALPLLWEPHGIQAEAECVGSGLRLDWQIA